MPDQPFDLLHVYESERRFLLERRRKAGWEPGPLDSLTGIALSGGGIRSATFCLGVLAGLNAGGLLRFVDYLSTVSGGGFVGSWWTAWLARAPRSTWLPAGEGQDARDLPQQLPAELSELRTERTNSGGDPLRHLRMFSNYLTPRKGLLSADSWRAFTVVLRNLLLTWAALVPVLLAAIVLGAMYFVVADLWLGAAGSNWLGAAGVSEHLRQRGWIAAAPVLAIAGWTVVLTVAWMQAGRPDTFVARFTPFLAGSILVALTAPFLGGPPTGPASPAAGLAPTNRILDWLAAWWHWATTHPAGWAIVAWLLVAAGLCVYALREPRDAATPDGRGELLRNQVVRVHATLLVAMAALALALGIAGFGHEITHAVFSGVGGGPLAAAGGWTVVLTAVAGSIFSGWWAAPTAAGDQQAQGRPSARAEFVLRATPPLVLIVLGLALAWGAHAMLGAFAGNLLAPRGLRFGAAIAILLCGIYTAYEGWTFRPAERDRHALTAGVALLLVLLLALARAGAPGVPWLVAAGGLALATVGVGLAVRRRRHPLLNTRPYWLLMAAFGGFVVLAAGYALPPDFAIVSTVVMCIGGWVLAVGWTADPNLLSLHTFYKARLSRAYLGASNTRRTSAHRITESAPGDDLPLAELAAGQSAGPYHLINTTLNLVSGRDLASAQRSSDRFLLSPLFCGSTATGYRPTAEYMGGRLQLGTAVAISGAAVSPTMGAMSPTAAVTMLLTLLNVRLGFWAPSPNKNRWQSERASMWPFYSLRELLSQTNELSSYCYLTDGGHFDNTGLYSLVERGCANVVVVDCGADPTLCFQDLGTAIRRCRLDFGAEFDLDLQPFLDPKPRHRLIVGTIAYAEAHRNRLRLGHATGVIAVIKPMLTGGETVDIRQYGFQNAAFPQQTTADQWFDEAQFESYRRLGELSAAALLDRATAPLPQPGATAAEVDVWFHSLRDSRSAIPSAPPRDTLGPGVG